MNPTEKKNLLINEIKKYKRVAVAFSGGVDSTFLLKMCIETLGSNNVIALTADCSAFPKRELDETDRLCTEMGATHLNIKINQLRIDGFVKNSPLRCYYCKRELMSQLIKAAQERGFNTVFEGSNADDDNDYRPGMRAVKELGVLSPLKNAELTKSEIRRLSKSIGLSTYSKPSLACLATRIEYDEKITAQKLKMTDEAEQVLCGLGLTQVRVRMHNNSARIEVPFDEMKIVFDNAEYINDTLKKIGYDFVSLDLEGYKTGKMNININN